ncbi:MAG: hypothetical protein HOK41_10560 [Nitrospina sp.]|jgi:hypothetical protein|nr:hypothetical protein [Nitrospina sp.]
MHLFKEENVQTTYPKRKPAKPVSHYILPITLLAVMVFLINALHRVTLPDPLGEKIQSHMSNFQKSNRTG